jgi:hypothetical protein
MLWRAGAVPAFGRGQAVSEKFPTCQKAVETDEWDAAREDLYLNK